MSLCLQLPTYFLYCLCYVRALIQKKKVWQQKFVINKIDKKKGLSLIPVHYLKGEDPGKVVTIIIAENQRLLILCL